MMLSRLLSQKAEAVLRRQGWEYEQLLGVRFAIIIFLASMIVWFVLQMIHDRNPVWALASMIAAADPQPQEARRLFRCRLLNVLVGCAVGFGFLVGGHSNWALPFGLTAAVLLSTYVVRIKTMWRQAPITAAIIIGASIAQGSALSGLQQGLHRLAEVLFGCFIGVLVSWLMSKVWLIKEKPRAELNSEKPV